MPMPDTKLQAQLDAAIDAFLAKLIVAQWAYLNAPLPVAPDALPGDPVQRRGRYFQGLCSCAALPENGLLANTMPKSAPLGQQETWVDLGLLDAQMPVAFTVSTYEGPQGAGYILYCDVIVAGVPWRRVISAGPERWRSSAWQPLAGDK